MYMYMMCRTKKLLREEFHPTVRAIWTLSWNEFCFTLLCQALDSSLQHPQLYAIKLWEDRKVMSE